MDVADSPSVCPVCASRRVRALESHRDLVGGKSYVVLACADCGLAFSRPLLFPGAPWYEKYNYVCGYAETACAASRTRFPYFLDRLPSPARGRLLDVGCASGHFLAMAAARGYEVDGLDVDSRFVKLAVDAGLTGVRQGVLDDEYARARRGLYDAVSIMEVLEHVDDPLGFLRLAGELLKPDGRLLVSVPDNRRPTPFGRDLWDYPPHHLTRWSPGCLRLALEKSGFVVEDMRGTPLHAAEFSRIWADRSAQLILRLIKRLLFGRDAAARPMNDLVAAAPSGPGGMLPEQGTRVRLVSLYHAFFNAVTYPAFALMLGYYRVTRPDAGLSLLAVARKA